jgi:hypothetical protein
MAGDRSLHNKKLQSKNMEKWRKRIKWKNREDIRRSKNVLRHESGQNNNGRGNASHTTSYEIDKESERGRDVCRYEDHPTGRQ